MKPESLTTLLKISGSSLNAAAMFNALLRTGHGQIVEYESTTGSGEVKSFFALTESGLAYGTNRSTLHEFKTEARFYPDKFRELLIIVAQAILAEAEAA